jgi:hypothetical protein
MRNCTLLQRVSLLAVAAWMSTALVGCGGGGSSGSAGGSGTSPAPIVNNVSVIFDTGPVGVYAINAPYTTVTVCAPGSTTQCQTIDHVLVDTGSGGFRVLASVLGSGVTSAQLKQSVDASGNALVECTQFVDGYSWGPVKSVDLKIGGETASSVSIQVIGDPSYPSSLASSACTNVPGGEEDTVAQFGANGVLGIGNFLQDCGASCASGAQDGSSYNTCTSGSSPSCQPAVAALNQQVSNPVASFAFDNNGVVLRFPTVAAAGVANLTGTLYFGIGTQSNNALGSATVYGLDPNYGTFVTTFKGTSLSQSFMDSGSNGYFFNDASIPICTDQSSFFCPTTTLALSAQIQGTNGTVAQVLFGVANADTIAAAVTVLPDLAGPAGASTGSAFDWGVPFFLGRNVYIGLEGTTLAGIQGPADAF